MGSTARIEPDPADLTALPAPHVWVERAPVNPHALRRLDRHLPCPYNVRAMRAQRLELRLTDDERQLGAAAAMAVGETLSDFFRRAAQTRAREVLADQHEVALTNAEAARFLDALETVDQDTVARLRELRERA